MNIDRNTASSINTLIGHDGQATINNAAAALAVLRMAITTSEQGADAWPQYMAGLDLFAGSIESALRFEAQA
jgi:hypothetical protein